MMISGGSDAGETTFFEIGWWRKNLADTKDIMVKF